MSTNNTKKRVFPPGIPAGAVCASKSGAMNCVSSPLEIDSVETSLHSFFKNYETDKCVHDAAEKLDDVSSACSDVLESSHADENDLRNAVFTELLDRKLNLEFPTEAKCREEKKDSKPAAENNEIKSSSEHSKKDVYIYISL